MIAPNSATRLAAFERRAKSAPDQVLMHTSAAWRYTAVHPFADDHELLQRLNWPAERCVSVDAYWECSGDVHFLQVQVGGDSTRGPGLYYRWEGNNAYAANLVAVIDGKVVVREAFESVMNQFLPALSVLGRAEKLTAVPEH